MSVPPPILALGGAPGRVVIAAEPGRPWNVSVLIEGARIER